MTTNSLILNRHSTLTSDSSEEEIGRLIDSVRSGNLSKSFLVELLSERHSVYKERPGYQAARIKGYAMASFAVVGLPDSALNFLLDELQNGKHAYMVAAAARGLRGTKRIGPQYVSFLLQALVNIRYHDDSVNLDLFRPTWPLKNPTTAKKEIFLTFQWMQGYAKGALPELRSFLKNSYDFDPETRKEIQKTIDIIETDDRGLDLKCCEIEGKAANGFSTLWKGSRNIKNIRHLEVENQAGAYRTLDDFIDRKPTVVAFFYTRCMNPNKCTLTINKLGWLQQELLKSDLQEKFNLLAFTYDPVHDTPTKMHIFGENRGMIFGPNVHMLRTRLEDFPLLSEFFELGVNHVGSTVNQHRLELFLLDQNGNIKASYTRLQWNVEKVLRDIKSLLKKSSRFRWVSSIANTTQQVGLPLLLAFFPKCPICWAVYLSAFGISGLNSIPYSPWLIPWIILAILINLILLYRNAKVRNGLTPFWLSLVGGLLVMGSGYQFSSQAFLIVGVVCILMGSLLNSLSLRQWSKLTHAVSSILKGLKFVSNYKN